jgi:hypothetical protein
MPGATIIHGPGQISLLPWRRASQREVEARSSGEAGALKSHVDTLYRSHAAPRSPGSRIPGSMFRERHFWKLRVGFLPSMAVALVLYRTEGKIGQPQRSGKLGEGA